MYKKITELSKEIEQIREVDYIEEFLVNDNFVMFYIYLNKNKRIVYEIDDLCEVDIELTRKKIKREIIKCIQ